MKSKYLSLLAASIFLASTAAYADWLDSDGILRTDHGRIRYVDQHDAMKACPQGTHLPTIRELAELSLARGAKILEMSQVNPTAVPSGYYYISAINSNGQKDEFFYNHKGYKSPWGSDLHMNVWWSSSLVSYYPKGYVLHGGDGFVDGYSSLHSYYFAVRCVVNQ